MGHIMKTLKIKNRKANRLHLSAATIAEEISMQKERNAQDVELEDGQKT